MPDRTPPVTHLLYLHGFRSSPQSFKAQRLGSLVRQQHPEVTWWSPQLPPSPREAMQLVLDGVAGWPTDRMGVVGSSLGGFYATHVAETRCCRAVLLNPSVHPARSLALHIGEQTAWHDPAQRFFFEPRFVDELRTLEHGPVAQPGHYFGVFAKGDEVLDWREMVERYPGIRVKLLEGGDHALSDFDEHIAEIMAFLGLGTLPA